MDRARNNVADRFSAVLRPPSVNRLGRSLMQLWEIRHRFVINCRAVFGCDSVCSYAAAVAFPMIPM